VETKENKHKRVGQMKSLPSISGKEREVNQIYIERERERSQHDTEAMKPILSNTWKFRPMLLITLCIIMIGVGLVLYTSRHQLGTCIKGSFVIVSMHFATK
jgi:hypothetical protein